MTYDSPLGIKEVGLVLEMAHWAWEGYWKGSDALDWGWKIAFLEAWDTPYINFNVFAAI